VEYGQIGLLLLGIVIAFVNFLLWRSTRAEADRISTQGLRTEAEYARLGDRVAGINEVAKDAMKEAQAVKGEYFTVLLRRIDAAEATSLGTLKQTEVFAEKLTAFSARLSSFARHHKIKDEATEAGNAAPEVAPAPPIPKGAANGTETRSSFGQTVRRR